MTWLRRLVEGAVGVALLMLAVLWLSGWFGARVAPGSVEPPARRMAPDDRVVAAELREEPATEWTSGTVASARRTAVSSRVLARIERIAVRAGSVVEEGDLLVVLDDRDLRARLGEVEEQLRAARARLELAEISHQRAEELYRQGVGTKQRLDQATSELRSARAAVRALERALEEARAARSHTRIHAPVSGRVVDRLAEPGDTALPGQPLLRIYDPTLLRVEVPVRESLAVDLRLGQGLAVEVPALSARLEGTVDELVPFAEPGARTLLVKVRLPRTASRLVAGMYARVGVPAGTLRRVLVPASAVEEIGQLEFVEVVDPEGRLERRLVTTGGRLGEDVEVLSGLRAGERVRLSPAAGSG